MKTIPQKAVTFAKKIARNNAHGYDNRPGHRLGDPDYACSSFVAACYIWAGVPVPANSYTASMKRFWVPCGFKDVSKKINFKTGKGLKTGDVLIAPGKHTAICVSTASHKLAEAAGNPRGGAQNGAPGDQTGHEIRIRGYYDDGWSQCLRYVGDGISII